MLVFHLHQRLHVSLLWEDFDPQDVTMDMVIPKTVQSLKYLGAPRGNLGWLQKGSQTLMNCFCCLCNRGCTRTWSYLDAVMSLPHVRFQHRSCPSLEINIYVVFDSWRLNDSQHVLWDCHSFTLQNTPFWTLSSPVFLADLLQQKPLR